MCGVSCVTQSPETAHAALHDFVVPWHRGSPKDSQCGQECPHHFCTPRLKIRAGAGAVVAPETAWKTPFYFRRRRSITPPRPNKKSITRPGSGTTTTMPVLRNWLTSQK